MNWLRLHFILLHLNGSFHIVDQLIDLVLGEWREVALRRQLVERRQNDFALAHEVHQFDVMIPVSLPNRIADDLIESLNPIFQPDSYMSVCFLKEDASADLFSNA